MTFCQLLNCFLFFIYSCFFIQVDAWANGAAEEKLQKIYQRLTGIPLSKRNPDYARLLELAENQKYEVVAEEATKVGSFFSITGRRWATLLFTQDQATLYAFNDFIATAAGALSDNVDARLLLTGDFIYGPSERMGMGRPSAYSNSQFEEISERRNVPLEKMIQRYEPQWEIEALRQTVSGLLTTRAWSEKNYAAGTNRVAVKNVLHSFLCLPESGWRDIFVPTYRIRQDVDRAPSGDPMTFQVECRGCHAPMDALGGAFASLDFINGSLLHEKDAVFPKMLRESQKYPDGFRTVDSSWINLLTERRHQFFGWRGETRGVGLPSLALMLSRSQLFSQCMVKRALDQVCGGKDYSVRDDFVVQEAQRFEQSGYRLRDLFVRLITQPQCLN